MRLNTKFWTESASLIVLARQTAKSVVGDCDYKVLVFQRSAKSKFMPSSTVFPGGATESCDESRDWLKLYESLGVTKDKFSGIINVAGERPPIFVPSVDNVLERELSLRITGIRETFEELGILMCKSKTDLDRIDKGDPFATCKTNFDVQLWQKKVHNDPTKFIELCHEQQIVPDLWGLHEWCSWLTPTVRMKRFETAFFLTAIQDIPEIYAEQNEVHSYQWQTPLDLLTAHTSEKIWLPPPQHYELSRLAGVPEIDAVAKFAKERGNKGTELYFPFIVKASDGQIHIYPGDASYPEKVDLQTGEGAPMDQMDRTMMSLRPKEGYSLNRTENSGINQGVTLTKNFTPHYAHLYPSENDMHTSKL